MNRRLLLVPVAGALAFGGSQLLAGGDDELPPEPVFPTVVGSQNAQDWTDDDWSVNRFVDDPFQPSLGSVPSTDPFTPPDEVEPSSSQPTDEAALGAEAPPTTTVGPAPVLSPTTTTTPPPTTTARDLSQAPPLAEDGSGVDLPEIDDLPDPLGDDDR